MTRMRDAGEALLAQLPRGARVFVQGCAGETRLLADLVEGMGDRLAAPVLTGIRVPGVNTRTWLPNDEARFETFFMTPALAAVRGQVTFLPLCYRDILRRLRTVRIDAAIFSVSPPSPDGICSFGPTVDFLAELWPAIPLRIAHINPLLPRTAGPTGIPRAALDAAIEAPESPIAMPDDGRDARSDAIARHVGSWIDDGATIQSGLGRLPGAILRTLVDRRGIRIHSGLIGDAVLDLLDAGAIAHGGDVVAGVAIGTQRLYDALPDSGIVFRPVSYTHDPATIAAQPRLVTINSAMAVDLFGQAYSETANGAWNSGTGGATDFARGVADDGLRIVALPATVGEGPRIVLPASADGPVTLSRTDIDVVVTEYGAADLRQRSHDARAAALIAIAAPHHRESLARGWREGAGRF